MNSTTFHFERNWVPSGESGLGFEEIVIPNTWRHIVDVHFVCLALPEIAELEAILSLVR